MLLAFVSFGQVTTSSVTGRIKDDKGEGLIGATVKATHIPSGTVYGTVTRTDGNYTIPGMRIGGPYKVEISFIGFTSVTLEGISLNLGEPFVINQTMTSGKELKTVNVVGSKAASFNQNKTGASTVVGLRQLQTLPTVTRNITDFTRLTPQANGNGFGGRDGRLNNLQVDGANLNNNFGLNSDPTPGGGASPISLDAYDQISVNIAPYDVRQSGFTGAGINAVTKSGTNDFHGSVYGYYRDQSFNGTKVHDNTLTLPKSENKIFGGTLGGAIIKNKLFFFVSGEYEKSSAPGITWQPTPTGFTGTRPANMSATPADSLKKLSDYLISKYGYNPGTYTNFPAFETKNHKILAKVDWNINSIHKLTLKYSDFKGSDNSMLNGSSIPNSTTGNAFVIGGGASGISRLPNNRFSNQSMAFSNSNYGTNHWVKSGSLELNSAFSNRMSNQFIITYTKNQDTRFSMGDVFPTVDIMDGTGKNYISFGSDPFTRNNDVVNNIFNVTDNFTLYKGDHTFTAGISYEYQKLGNMFMPGSASYYIYNTLADFMNNAAPAFYANTYTLVPGDSAIYSANLKIGQLGAYVQDEWNVRPNFKLTVGLRADLPIYPSQPLENPAITALSFPDKDGNMTHFSTGKWPNSKLLLSPRVGFRWDVLGDKSLIVRGGTGIFTGKIPFVYLTNMPTNSGMYQNQVVLNKAADLAGITFNPNASAYLSKFPTSPSPVAPSGFTLVDPKFKFPQVWRSNVGIDKALGGGFTATFEAMFTKDINAVIMRNPNLLAPTKELAAGGDDRPWYGILANQSDKYLNKGQTTVVIMENTSKGYSMSFTGQLSKTFSNGLYGSVAYTYTNAKDVTGNPGNQAASIWQSNPNVGTSNSLELGPSQYAMPHRVVANVSYRKEYAKHFASTLSLFYEGSNLSTISYVVNGDINGDGNSSADLMYIYKTGAEVNFSQYTYNAGKPDQKVFTVADQQAAYDQFINSSKYLKKHKGEYAARNGAVLPWYNRLDARFLQDFYLTTKGGTRHTLQFSVDMLNLPNLLSKNWGVRQQTTLNNPLVSKGVNANGTVNYQMANIGGTLVNNAYQDNISNLSTWGMQLGLRYSF
ncbi:carboxypeptidase family protein [Chitinophaga dinghuensis]|uniref:Carboxypeptidase family protein n=1 Tax=Chitinophaga dinghuensis TaxID=1539050 RepID=A0A327VXS4_9BACT|nr:TonB-dependent receptor [Chitinophaga dinghuensis]RAJ81779.1 carboxypeptidase family protein [Chitinophaga dinghuensis]